MASDRPPPKLAPPPGEGARYDAFERETLRGLNESLRGVLALGRESNRILGQLADVLGKVNDSHIAARDLAQIQIAEQRLTREVLRDLKDEIALLRAERKRRDKTDERTEATAVKARPIRKVAG